MIIMIRVIKTGDNNEPAANNRNQRLTKSNLKLWPNKQKPHIEVLPPPLSHHPLTTTSLSPRLASGASAPEDRTASPPPPNLRAGNLINFHADTGSRHKNKTSPESSVNHFTERAGGGGESLPVCRGRDGEGFECVSIENVCSCPEWRRCLRPHSWLTLPTSQSPSFCSQMKCFAPEIHSAHLLTATGFNSSNTALTMTCFKMNMGRKQSQSVNALLLLFCHQKVTIHLFT